MMIGEHDGRKRCPVCGGALYSGLATIPYTLEDDTVVVVKQAPAEICSECRETFTSGLVTDRIVNMVKQLKHLKSEVTVLTYSEYEPA